MKNSEFARGWHVVLASLVGMMFGISALPFYTLGVFAKPIIHEFGWTRGQYQGAFMGMVIGAFTAPVVGLLCDRFGVRRVALVSTAGFAAGLAGIGLLTRQSIATFYFAWALMAVLGQGTGPLAWTRIISEWFTAYRGLALGVAFMGSGITAFIGPPIATALIAAVGWRHTYEVFGASVLLIAWPTLYVFLKPRPDASGYLDASTPTSELKDLEMSLGDALGSYRFWVIATAFFIVAFCVAGVISNLIPLLIDRGLSAQQAAGYASIIGVAVIVGRVLVGYLIDRFWAPGVAFVLLALPAISCFILGWVALGPAGIFASLLIVGLAAGAEFDIMAYLVGRYFGMKNYGKIYGMQYAIFFLGAALAPGFFGASFDHRHSYGFILSAAAAAFVAAAALLLSLGRYSDQNRYLTLTPQVRK